MPLQSWSTLVNDAGDAAEDFEILPAADYDMKVVKAEAKQTKTNKLTFALRSQVTSGPYKGRLVFSNLTLSPENPTALGIFFRQMAAIGVSKEFFAQNPSDHQVAEALEGCEFRAQVAIRTWQGQERNDIKTYSRVAQTAASGPQGAPVPPMSSPSPLSSPPAFAGASPANRPLSAPPAAATAAPKAATVTDVAPEPVTQATLPPVIDTPTETNVEEKVEKVEPVSTVSDAPSPAADAPAAPADPF